LKTLFFAIPGQNSDHIERETRSFLQEIKKNGGPEIIRARGKDISFPEPSLVLVQSGGTERKILDSLQDLAPPYFLLAGDKFNALPAALEVLSFLRGSGVDAEIIHGSTDYMAGRLEKISLATRTLLELSRWRLGMVGDPSDWLIASSMNPDGVKKDWGIEIVNIKMEELESLIDRVQPSAPGLDLKCFSPEDREGALKIYAALEEILSRYELQGLTLRCFDLLGSRHNTGCLGLSLLNDQGLVGGCEGDVPALISMAILRVLTGKPSFMANPARVDKESNEIILAHCTVPLGLTSDYSLHTHFESGLGIGLRGKIPPGPCTVFKLGADGRQYFASRGEIIENLERKDLCRTQVRVKMEKPVSYFLSRPLGNHHLLVSGDYVEQIEEIFRLAGLK